MFNFLQICLLQGAPELERARTLRDILVMRNDELVPQFLTALKESDQQHVVNLLLEGLHTFCCIIYFTRT